MIISKIGEMADKIQWNFYVNDFSSRNNDKKMRQTDIQGS